MRLAVFDFDGVFTDNRVWVNERREESVRCCRGDGLGLRRLDEVGVDYLIVSMEKNPIVGARAQKLEVDCVQGVDDKLSVAPREAVPARVSTLEDTAFVGNDINDAECLRRSGSRSCRPTRGPRCRALARWVLARPGGEGCVREFCDAVWEAQRVTDRCSISPAASPSSPAVSASSARSTRTASPRAACAWPSSTSPPSREATTNVRRFRGRRHRPRRDRGGDGEVVAEWGRRTCS